jgi:flagellin
MKVNGNSVSGMALNTMNTQEAEKEKELKNIASGKSVSSMNGASQIIFDMLQSSSSELLQGVQNGNDAIGYMQIADTALQSVTDGAQQLNVLSVAMNNASLKGADKAALSAEAQAVQASMGQAVNSATYNGTSVFGSSTFSMGSSAISVNIEQPDVSNLNITDQRGILEFLNQTDNTRATIGSTINETVAGIKNNLGIVSNQKASASEIGDTDMASATNQLNKNLLLMNASEYSLAHNQSYLAKQASRLLGA